MSKTDGVRQSLYLSTLIFTALFAQDSTQFEQSDTQMMQKMQGVQICMGQIDFNELSSMQEEALQVKMEVKEMCAQGKRDQAKKKAELFYDKVMKLPAIVQMKVCTKEIIPDFELKQGIHVCDAETMDFGIPDTKRINW